MCRQDPDHIEAILHAPARRQDMTENDLLAPVMGLGPEHELAFLAAQPVWSRSLILRIATIGRRDQ